MKSNSFFLLSIVMLTTIHLSSQSNKLDNNIVSLYENSRMYFKNLDARGMASLYTDDAIHISPVGQITYGKNAIQSNYENLFNMFKSMPQADQVIQDMVDEHHQYINPETVLVSYIDRTTSSYGKKIEKNEMAINLIIVKQNNHWLIKSISLIPVILSGHM